MKKCSFCGKEVVIDKYFNRKSRCPNCGEDLHICLNCRFYSETSHNKCIEPKADFQRVRNKANFCDYFSFKDSVKSSSDKEKEDARRKLEDLFKNF